MSNRTIVLQKDAAECGVLLLWVRGDRANPGAVLNLFTAADEAIGGAVAGGILSGGQIAAGNVDAFLERFLDGDAEAVRTKRGSATKRPYRGEIPALLQGGALATLTNGGVLVPMFRDAEKASLETENQREFAEFQAVLGDDAPKSLVEFLNLKYNRPDSLPRIITRFRKNRGKQNDT